MPPFICTTCGVQHADSPAAPELCVICEDERQPVGADGQRWTTLEALRSVHTADLREEEPSLLGIGMSPSFGIGQRALLVETPEGNVLWDCVPLLDEEILAAIFARGGLAAVAISHPHFYATMAEWGRALDVPILLHAADRRWVMRPDDRIVFWEGATHALPGGITLVRLGGHFAGSAVLHWPSGGSGGGALLSGDTVQVVADRHWVSFMRSYPNLIPLPASVVRRMAAVLAEYRFERVYGGWYGRVVASDGDAAVARSAERYARALEHEPD